MTYEPKPQDNSPVTYEQAKAIDDLGSHLNQLISTTEAFLPTRARILVEVAKILQVNLEDYTKEYQHSSH